ncbi:hypothetical protein SAMN05216522_102130 [Rosenbergiella nectarea]|uniref:Uncharacterized protein n=1 Tax=Rosenbergiella nectarea TaxID=988801 RepID=A0A1H9F3F0_9GAMM|nr:hypothetical protein [Rosenbergiella nectarea]SEQ31738.1 hypothetical protein SAMN05216522_102130 [Rosenbergiella nectarea]
MQSSIQSNDAPFIDWVKNLIIMAENNDLSSREIESYTAKITEQATQQQMAVIVSQLLNYIRIHQ